MALRNKVKDYFVILFVVAVAPVSASVLEMPMTKPLQLSKFSLRDEIPLEHRRLPGYLPIFRYSEKPRSFSLQVLQQIVDESAFKGTNITSLTHTTDTDKVKWPLRMVSSQNLDFFFVDPLAAKVVSNNRSLDTTLHSVPSPSDIVPSYEEVLKASLDYAEALGIPRLEIERNIDGSIFVQRSDLQNTLRGGAVKFTSRRGIRLSRSFSGYGSLGGDDKFEVAMGVNGALLRLEMNWRNIKAIRTNTTFTIDQLIEQVRDGKVVADETVNYPQDGVTQIILKDIRIFYFVPPSAAGRPLSTRVDIVPLASFHAVFKSKHGNIEEGALFTRLDTDGEGRLD